MDLVERRNDVALLGQSDAELLHANGVVILDVGNVQTFRSINDSESIPQVELALLL